MKQANFCHWLRMGCAAITVVSAPAFGQLPSESEVPGGRAPAALPAESDLPPYVAAQAAPQTQDTQPTTERSELPSEQAVPAAQATPLDPTLPNDLPLRGSPDGIPWLRLNLRGHTAPLRALVFSNDGRRILTAGEDKSLVAWAASPDRAGELRWGYERIVRWQIQRGTRGRIYALATSPQAIALAGEGAMAASGEILLIDPRTGELSAALNDENAGHQQVVVALNFAPGDAQTLASLSMDGTLVQWQPNANDPDVVTHAGDDALVQRLLAGRTLSAVAAIDGNRVVAPVYVRQANGRLIWQLAQYDARTGARQSLATGQSAPHWDSVMALAASGDGRRLASSDGGGYVYLWDLSASPVQVRELTRMHAWSLAFDARGERLVVGGDAATDDGPSRVEVWDLRTPTALRRIAQFDSRGVVAAAGLTPDGNSVAWTSGSRAFVRPVAAGAPQELPAGVSPPLRVAFPAEKPYYHLGLAKGGGASSSVGGIDRVFDADLLRLDQLSQPTPARWLPEAWLSNGWTVRQEGTVTGQRTIWLYEGGARRSQAPINEARHGWLTASGWIPSRVAGAAPLAAAIGTSGGGIFLVTPTATGEAPIVHQLRGHSAAITSLAVSRDLRYLASSSLDGTVRVWPIADFATDSPLMHRWGAEFRVVGGELIADAVRPNGPVHFRGMRTGDRLVEVSYADADEELRTFGEPDAMHDALSTAPWNAQVTFRYSRGRAAQMAFQLNPAWQQLATLFVADDGEWAYWHPAGYYDASFEGHKLFGWQINRGLEMLPDFFLAAQFRGRLEKPSVMSQLLRRGTLDAAFRAAQVEAPARTEEAIVNAYRLKPQVEILSPREGDATNGAAKVTARISLASAERLTPPKAFANGVVAIDRRLLSEEVTGDVRVATYEWDLRLPADPRVRLQVAAATESEVTGEASIVVANEAPKPATPPRLFLLSVGVDRYHDAQIPRLTTAVKTTDDFASLLQTQSAPLYRVSAASLIDERATKANWRFLTAEYARQLARDASPNDLAIVFLSGHGIQAPGDDGYQFVTADARYSDVMAGRYNDCLSIADLAFLADVPCRKLIVLNTCHSGAAAPLVHRELKSAVRALQGDMMLTLAASGGEEEAVEGRFSRRLLDALGGAADDDGDGVVSLAETVAFVERTVAADSASDAVRQSPSTGPAELLRYVAVPLTVSNATRLSGSP
jgi:WD40 repeat protein